MWYGRKNRTNHYELNYLICEGTALRLRDYVRSYLEFDEYSVGQPDYSYPVHLLCLDSDDWCFYRQAINDLEHRVQLRVRYVSDNPDSPVRLEIKRRMADVVIRKNCEVRQETVDLIFSGQFTDPSHLVSESSTALQNMHDFVEALTTHSAKPKLHIRYLRESYVSDNEAVRVTMDRCIECEPEFTLALQTSMRQPHRLFAGQVLLELAFVERFPAWFGEMVRVFDLMECETDKFLSSVQAVGNHQSSMSNF